MVKLTIEADTKKDLLASLKEIYNQICDGNTSGYTGSVAWDLTEIGDEEQKKYEGENNGRK